jgi:type IV pilus assembly protein PilY1
VFWIEDGCKNRSVPGLPGGYTMKTTKLQRLILTFCSAVLVIVAASSTANATTYTYYARSYFGDATPAAIPGNGNGGTVSISLNTSTTDSTTSNNHQISGTSTLNSRTLTVIVTPTAGTYRIKSIKWYQATNNTVPTTGSSWSEVSADTAAYNTDVLYNFTRTVSKDNEYYYIWVLFEVLPTFYAVTPSIFKDVPDNPALAAQSCMLTAKVKYKVDGTLVKTKLDDTVIADGTVMADGAVIQDAQGTPIKVNLTPTSDAHLHFTFENTNTDCEVYGVSFNPPSLPPADNTFVQQVGNNTYTTPQITHTIGAADVVVRYRHKGYVITVTPVNTTPSCGSISPIPSATYESGTPSVAFTVQLNLGCGIDSVIVTDPTAGLTASEQKDNVIASSNTYAFNNISGPGSITVTFKKVSTTLGQEYCQVPSFIAGQTTLKPNVLLIIDNSASMGSMNMPYGSYPTTCTSSSTLTDGTCTNYYGYFDPGSMYKCTANNVYLVDSAATLNLDNVRTVSSTCNTSYRWSGNQLNNALMWKIDIVRKILIGGTVDSSYLARGGEDDTSKFYLRTENNVKVEQTIKEPKGLIQNSSEKIRFGLMAFHTNHNNVSTSTDGGYVAAQLGSDVATLVSTIEGSAFSPSTYTPLAETLYEAIRYYQAKPSAYNSGVDYGDTSVYAEPIEASCQKHFVLILTDGAPTCDQNLKGNTDFTPSILGTDNDFNVKTWWDKLAVADRLTPSDAACNGTPKAWLPAVAYYAHNTDLRSATVGKSEISGIQNLTIYNVFAFGDTSGGAVLKAAGKYGAYLNEIKNSDADGVPDAGEYTTATGTETVTTGYYPAKQGEVLEKNLTDVFNQIITVTASGTAAAVANNKSGERGANMIQALFYPEWPGDFPMGNDKPKWMGEVQALWYYLDPVISYSGIYEDTDGNKQLNLLVDKALSGDSFRTKSLWRAGAKLQTTSAADRNIYTPISVNFATTNPPPAITGSGNYFKSTNLSVLRGYMNLGTTSVISDTQAGYLIDYIRGADRTEYRPRKVKFTDPVTGTLNTADYTEWKLGDIINSTPTVQSSIALNAYDKAYSDSTYLTYINSNQYKARNVVYTSSNDGMMHAFRLGLVTNVNSGTAPNLVANMTGTDLGKEEWAFIPKNALPYLQNQTGKDYCHQCLVDGAPTIVDASIFKPATNSCTDYWDCVRKTTVSSTGNIDATETTWGTVLVSGMGLGGATRDKGTSTSLSPVNCNRTTSSTSAKDCVSTPVTGLGLSSYYALDVTTPLTPKYMWEFSDYSIADAADKGLGFTTSGAAIVRINARESLTDPSTANKGKNGRWFAVFASGPTGQIEQASRQFLGRSDQKLKIYVVDLNATMPFTKGTNYWVFTPTDSSGSEIKFAFANSLSGSVVDLDRWDSTKTGYYSDDVVYITYTKASLCENYPDDGSNTNCHSPAVTKNAWDKGGAIRLVTKNDPDPTNWFTSSLVEGTGPITSSIGKIQDRNNSKLWVYFGEGRYFYSGDETNTTRKFYGVEDPCYKQYSVSAQAAMGVDAASCPVVSGSDLQDQGGTPPAIKLDPSKKGWYITMDAASGTSGAERIVSDVTATTNGIVFYTTFTPNTNVCEPGGSTSLWAVKYDTGGTPPAGSLVGKAPVQTSSGGITLIDLGTKFTEKSGRKLDSTIHADGSSLMGMASGKGIRPLMSNKGLKRILHVQEQ